MPRKRNNEITSKPPTKKRRSEKSSSRHNTAEYLLELTSLPAEVLLLIFCYLDPASIINLKLVSHYFHALSKENAIWKNKIFELKYTFFESNPNLYGLNPRHSEKSYNVHFENQFKSFWRHVLDINSPDQNNRVETKNKICNIFQLLYETSDIEQIINAIQILDQDEREYCRIHSYLNLWFKYAVKKGLTEVVSFLYHHTYNMERLSLFSLSSHFSDQDATQFSRPDHYTSYAYSPLGLAISHHQVATFELLLQLNGLNYYQINGDIIPENCIEVALDLLHFAVSRRTTACMPTLIQACTQYRDTEANYFDPDFSLINHFLEWVEYLDGYQNIFDLFLSTGFYPINDKFLNFIFLNHSEEKYTEIYFSLLGLINQWQITSWNDELKIADKLIYFRELATQYDNVGAYCALQKFLGINLQQTKSDKLLLALKKYANQGCIAIFHKLCESHHKENPSFINELGTDNYCRLVHKVVYHYLASSISKFLKYNSVNNRPTEWFENHEDAHANRVKHDAKVKVKKALGKDLLRNLSEHRTNAIEALLKMDKTINLNQFTDDEGNTFLHQVWYFFSSDLNGTVPIKYYKTWLFSFLEIGIADQKNNVGNSLADIANGPFNEILARAREGLEMKTAMETFRFR
jgi:hypothetical protein